MSDEPNPRTPPTTTIPNLPESPSHVSHMQSAPADVDVATSREFFIKDLGGSVNEVEVRFFTQGLLPPVTSTRLKEVFNKLKESKELVKKSPTGGLRWKHFSKEPSDYKIGEDSVFKRMERLVAAIAKAAGVPEDQRTVKFVCRPTQAPKSTSRNNPSKPDSYGILANSSEVDPKWIDIAIPGEFKKAETENDQHDNRRKILWSMYHIMREDPTRRFVYGFTIENTHMRFWFISRSEIFASYKFNFIENPPRVILFFLPLLTATKVELGWDETIRRLPDVRDATGNHVYDIEVGNKTYRTTRLISNIGAEAPRGRGTRVWEVCELDKTSNVPFGPSRALKDNWMDASRPTEGKILEDIQSSGSPNDQQVLKERFMEIIGESHVYVGNEPDHTHVVMRRNRHLEDVRPLRVAVGRVTRGPKNVIPVKGNFTLPHSIPEEGVVYSAKIHHRVVFSKVGRSLYEVDSMQAVFVCITDVIVGLRSLHAAGWVHRDISPGNILLVNGRGYITDVEYAKRVTDKAVHGVRTGTPYFMAVEVELRCYQFAALIKDKHRSGDKLTHANNDPHLGLFEQQMALMAVGDSSKVLALAASAHTDANSSSKVTREVVAFRHNPLHDIESVLWVSMWMILCSKLQRPATMDENLWNTYMLEHGKIVRLLFCNTTTRVQALTGRDQAFTTNLERLLPKVAELGKYLNDFREALISQYSDVERDLHEMATNLNPAQGLHAQVGGYIIAIWALLAGPQDLAIDVEHKSEQAKAVDKVVEQSLDEAESKVTEREDESDEWKNFGGDPDQPDQSHQMRKRQKTSDSEDDGEHVRDDLIYKKARTCEDW